MAGKITPERQKLADAQRAQTEAKQRLAAIEAVASDSWELTRDARKKVEAAEAALAGSSQFAVADMVARRMGQDVLDRPSGAALKANLTTAQAELEAATAARAEIERQHQEAKRAADWAGSVVSNAMAEVLQTAPEVNALTAKIRELEDRLIECHAALCTIGGSIAHRTQYEARLLAPGYTNPCHPDWHLLKTDHSAAVAAEWRMALDRLQTDAAAPLPSNGKRPLFG